MRSATESWWGPEKCGRIVAGKLHEVQRRQPTWVADDWRVPPVEGRGSLNFLFADNTL